MARQKTSSSSAPSRSIRPAITPEARENQMIALSVDAAEKRLLDGTAPAQLIVHYLKLGTSKEKLEIEKLREEIELLKAKKEAIESQEQHNVMYQRAIDAMRRYSGHGDEIEDDY